MQKARAVCWQWTQKSAVLETAFAAVVCHSCFEYKLGRSYNSFVIIWENVIIAVRDIFGISQTNVVAPRVSSRQGR